MRNSCVFICLLSLGCIACWSVVPLRIGESSSQASIDHGRKIVQGVAACGFCHGESRTPGAVLSGGQELEDRYGSVIAPNLTPDETGLKGWSTADLVRVLRNSVDRDGEEISKDFHEGYEWMSDVDILGVVAYLKSLPPIRAERDQRELSFLDRNIAGFSHSWDVIENYVPELPASNQITYGQYLVDQVANCNSCHNAPDGWFSSGEYLKGGKIKDGPAGERSVPGIANSETDGIRDWRVEDIVLYLKSGRKPDGKTADGNYCPYPFYARSDESNLLAIAKYLKSLP